MKTQLYNFKLTNTNIIDNFLSSSPKLIKSKLNFKDDSSYQKIKRYFQTIKKNDYTIKESYIKKDNNRQYGNGGKCNVQQLPNKIRSILFNDSAYDIDMVNAWASIYHHIILIHFTDKIDDLKTLIDYSQNREDYLKYDKDKSFFRNLAFNVNCKTEINKDIYDNEFNRLILEISMFQQLVLTNLEKFDSIEFKSCKNEGSKISTVYSYYENKILTECLDIYSDHVIAPIFDGFLISKTGVDLESVLTKCNEIGSKYQVKFIHKEFPDVEIDLDTPPCYEDQTQNAYNEMKQEFETKHFMVENPLMFLKEKYDSPYSKRDFKDIVATYRYKNADDKMISFFDNWLVDDDRRCYETIKWIPSLEEEHNSETNYNTFKGFDAELVDVPDIKQAMTISSDDYDCEAVLTFIEHLNLLVNHDKKGREYLTKYIAHMFQKPTELPLVALLFKSEEGIGKDLMTDILGKILGNGLCYKEPKMANLTGDFNSCIQNRIIVQLDEVCGKDGHFNRDLLKNLITAPNINVRKMRTDIQVMPNYIRLMLATNNGNVIHIPADDRRYVVFKCADLLEQSKRKAYYDKLGDILKSQTALNSIYSYFMNKDISKFNIRDRYISQEYLNLQEQNQNPFYEFIYSLVLNNTSNVIKGITCKGIKKSFISGNDIKVSYEEYLKEFGYNHLLPLNNKSIKPLMLERCTQLKKRINNKEIRGYQFDKEEFLKYLKNKYKLDQNENDDIVFDINPNPCCEAISKCDCKTI